jgi:hypothetical protein
VVELRLQGDSQIGLNIRSFVHDLTFLSDGQRRFTYYTQTYMSLFLREDHGPKSS